MDYVRPDWVRRINAMAPGVGGAAAMVSLDPDELLDRASTATGLDDFGAPGWDEPLRRLVDALETEAQLSVVGRLLTRHDLLRHLCTRLLLREAHRADPSLAAAPVPAPVIVTGPARSGTSILHELLAQDPGLRGPLGYEMAYPLPPAATTDEQRVAWAEPEFDLWADVQPEFAAVHELSARLPEECIWLLAPEFDSGFWATCTEVPSFLAWRAGTDAVALYRAHRSFLQVLQGQVLQRGRAGHSWVLKSPVHLSRLPAVFAVYPDARVIRTHRDPAKTVPSAVSTVATGRWLRSDDTDPQAVCASVSFGFQMILNGAAEQRASLPDGQIADLHYVDLLRDPVAAISKAYGDLGMDVAPELPDRITSYLANRPQTKFGVHRYSPGDFGLDVDQVRRDFAPYIDAFAVEAEPAS